MALSAHFNSALNNLALDMYANTYQARMESGAEPPKTREEFLQLFKTMFDVKVKPEKMDDDDDVVIIDPPPKVMETVSVEPTAKIDSRDLKKKLASFKFKPEGANRATQMELPYLPSCVDYSHSCQALQFSGGLFSPCLTRGQGICKSCVKTESKYGTIQDREDSEVDKRLKRKKISYGTWCARRGASREFVESWLKENAPEIVIAEEDWVVDTKAVRAPRKKKSEKSASTSSDEETSSVESVEPASVVSVDAKAPPSVESVDANDAEKAKAKAENDAEKVKAKAVKDAEKAKAKAVKEAEKAKAKAEKEAEKAKAKAEKEAEKAKAKAEKEAKKEEKAKAKAEKEAKKEEKAMAKAEKEAKKEEKAMAKAEKEPEKVEKIADKSAVLQTKKTEKLQEPQEEHDELSDDELEENEHYKHKFWLDGKNYGVDNCNDVFEINEKGDPSFAGTWDPESEEPVFE